MLKVFREMLELAGGLIRLVPGLPVWAKMNSNVL